MFEILETGVGALEDLSDEPLLVLRLPEVSPLIGKTLAESKVGRVDGSDGNWDLAGQ